MNAVQVHYSKLYPHQPVISDNIDRIFQETP